MRVQDEESSGKPSDRQRPNAAVSTAAPLARKATRQSHYDREEDIWKLLETQEIELVQTKARLEATLAEKDEINQEWKRATHDLNRLQAERNYKIDDDYFIAAWKELTYEVKNWAFQHFEGKIQSPIMRFGPSRELQKLAQDVRYWLRSPRLRPLIAQAWVWNVLQHRVFACTGENIGLVWAGIESWKLRHLRSVLKPSSSTISRKLQAPANCCSDSGWA